MVSRVKYAYSSESRVNFNLDLIQIFLKYLVSNYAFIDSQNLNLGVKSLGWELDWRKLRQYLRNKYSVEKAFLFIGHKKGNESLYFQLKYWGFEVILKPTLILRDGTVKGNVDAELVLHTMIELPHFSNAIVISGDGDFYCLYDYLHSVGKLAFIMVPNKNYSSLLRKFNNSIIRIDLLKTSLEYKKTKINGRSKP